MSFPSRISSAASALSDACLGAALAGNVLFLGGADLRWAPCSWGLLAVALVARWFERRAPWDAAVLWLVPFVAWLAVRAAWSPMAWEAWREVEHWVQALVVFLLASSARHPWRAGWLVGAAALASIAGAAWQLLLQPGWLPWGREQVPQYFGRASGTFGNPNSFAAFLLVLAGPLCGVALDGGRHLIRRAMAGYGALLVVVAALFTASRGVALAVGVCALAATLCSRRWRLAAAAAGVCVLVVALAPALRERALLAFSQGGETARVAIWPASVEAALERPVAGWGGGMFRVAFEQRRPPGFGDDPVHAHNEVLELWLEHGAVGVALALTGVSVIWIQLFRRRRGAACAGPALALAALALACLVDFHLRVPAVLLCAAWVAGAARAAQKVENPAAWFVGQLTIHTRRGLVAGALVTMAGLACLAFAVRAARAENELQLAMRELRRVSGGNTQEVAARRAGFGAVRDKLRLLCEEAPGYAQAWADLSAAELLAEPPGSPGRGEAARGAVSAAREALSLSAAPAEFWVRLGNALQAEGRPTDAATAALAFQEALRRAPRSALVWYHYAYFLASRQGTAHLALVAIENCLQLDPSHRAAQDLRQRLSSFE
ncbi:O-antigen ligase family protein [Nibricoccus sp. IMCC34717]|uniref:O-antigen ligase family protein n=1 Tax=Nibricoccus sp. IMCC34717 TaxID=3034021 RepID=UPI00384D27D5